MLIIQRKNVKKGTSLSTHTDKLPIKTKDNVHSFLRAIMSRGQASQLDGVESNLNYRVNGLTKPGVQSEGSGGQWVTAVWSWTRRQLRKSQSQRVRTEHEPTI